MEFKYTSTDKIGRYELKGNLIGETDGISITESFGEAIADNIHHFVIDLEDLQHINSSGLGVLITLLTKARKIGGELVLAKPSSYIKNLLLITKLDTIFKIHPNVEEAINAYKDSF